MAGPIDALIQEWSDAFDEQVTDTTNRLDASGTYNFNVGRHRFIEDFNTDGGTFIRDAAETTALDDLDAKMQVTASAGEEHLFGGRELIRYVPNYELLFGSAAWAESELQDGQHYAIEFCDLRADNGYRYHYFGSPDGPQLNLEQRRAGNNVNVNDAELDELEARLDFDHTRPAVSRGKVNWYGAGQGVYELSFPTTDKDDPEEIREQDNPIIGYTANRDDVATDESNLFVQVRVWAETGAPDVTVNVCSLGAMIRGGAREVDREKPSIFWNIGGTISQYPTDNVEDAMAARVDPTRTNIACKMEPPLFQPGGSGIIMELGVYAVHKDHPDLTVNFDDPDDDGVDEGPRPAAQARASTDPMQYTRDVTSIPTQANEIRADGSTGEVPDMRHLTSTVGSSGGGNTPGSTTGGELAGIKRLVFPDDVVIFLPRTRPTGSTTNGVIRYMKPLFELDF